MDLIKIFRTLENIHKSQRRTNAISILKELYSIGSITQDEYEKQLKTIANMEGFTL